MLRFLAFLLVPAGVFAQAAPADSVSPPVFFLALDGYLRFADTKAESLTSPTLAHDQLSLGWFSAGASHEWGKAGVSGKLAFGPRAQQFFAADDGAVLGNVREAFAFLDLTEAIRINAGLFPNFYGYEYDDPSENPLYSSSWAYTYSPAGLTGLQIELTMGDAWTLMLARYNDVFSRFTAGGKATYGSYLTYEQTTYTFTLSALTGSAGGEQDIVVIDLVAQWTPAGRTTLGTELVYQPFRNLGDDWTHCSSVGLYLTYDLTEQCQLALRGEYVDDTGGFNFDRQTKIVHTSAAVSRTFGALKAFGELRLDTANTPIFPDGGHQALAGLLGFGYLLR